MSIDVERTVTEALAARVEEITPDRLRHHALRERRQDGRFRREGGLQHRARSRSRALLLLATVCVLAVVTGAGVAARTWFGDRSSVGPSAGPYIGQQWRLDSVRHAGQLTPVSPGLGATVTLAGDGHFGINDSVNYRSGRYTLTGTGFTTHDTMTTLAGYAGDDPVVLLVLQALHALVSTPVSPDSAAPGAEVDAYLSGDALVLRVPDYEMSFRRDAATG